MISQRSSWAIRLMCTESTVCAFSKLLQLLFHRGQMQMVPPPPPKKKTTNILILNPPLCRHDLCCHSCYHTCYTSKQNICLCHHVPVMYLTCSFYTSYFFFIMKRLVSYNSLSVIELTVKMVNDKLLELLYLVRVRAALSSVALSPSCLVGN